MKRIGWFKESHRHSLAARGIKTNRYMAPKAGNRTSGLGTGGTGARVRPESRSAIGITSVEKNIGAQKRVETMAKQDIASRRPAARDIENVAAGQGSKIADRLLSKEEKRKKKLAAQVEESPPRDPRSLINKLKARRGPTKLTDRDKADLLALSRKAVEDTNKGVPVDPQIKELLQTYSTIPEARTALQQLQTAEKAERREREGFLQKEVRELGEDATIAAADAPKGAAKATAAFGEGVADIEKAGLKGIGQGREEFLSGQGTTGINTKIDSLGSTSFVGTNVAVGNEETGMLRPIQEPLPPLSSTFDEIAKMSEQGKSDNVLLSKGERTFSDNVDTQVDQLFNARTKLADVDLNAFKAGTKAFESGDREGLIESISDLKREEDKIANRWSAVEQTKKNVTSVNNHQSLFAEPKSNNIIFSSSRGGERLAEQTKKVEDVFKELKDTNDKLFARRRMLQFRLQRLDANVLPEQGAPDFDEIKRFNDEKSNKWDFSSTLTDNPGLQVFK